MRTYYTLKQLADLGWLSPEEAADLRHQLEEIAVRLEKRLDAAANRMASQRNEIAELRRRVEAFAEIVERAAKGGSVH